MRLDRDAIVWDRFDGLEPHEESWRADAPFWEEFTAAMFRSNGLAYAADRQSNVAAFVEARDRAPFCAMVDALLPRLAARTALDGVDLVLLAHWLPDLHLGTSVTNYAMHALGLNTATGFAVSDRGLAAPLLALDFAARWRTPNGRALVMVMDQKHLLYRSPEIEAIAPENCACLMLLDAFGREGLGYAGYRREPLPPDGDPRATAIGLARALALEPAQTTVIAPPALAVRLADAFAAVTPADPRLVCTAPFAALAALPPGDVLILAPDGAALTAVGFFEDGRTSCA